MSFQKFVISNARFLAFGFALALFSSFGQTFFISLFNDDVRAAFDLSHGAYGLCYSLATLASGLMIIWVGKTVDDIDLRRFSVMLCVGLATACGVMAWSPMLSVLVLALFLLRLTGQGLLSHTAMTSMARYFDADRGKAMSVAGLGFPAGEAILPFLAVVAIDHYGWRITWLGIGVVLGLALTPLVLWLLHGHADRHRDHLAMLDALERSTQVNDPADGDRAVTTMRHQWTRREMLGDIRFYLILPAVIAPGFIVTGLFFHQVHLVAVKGWTMLWFAFCFAVFAGAQVPAGLIAGPLVDRFGAKRLLPTFLLPLCGGLFVLALFDHRLTAAGFMAMAGVTSGIASPIVGSMWAEMYGVRHLGAIRALITAILVFGTAGSPVAMGWLIDAGISMEMIAWMCCGYIVLAVALARTAMIRAFER